MKVSEFLGMKVLDKNGYEVGKVTDIEIDPLKGSIDSIDISKGEVSFKSQVFLVSVDKLDKIGDYIILSQALEDIESNETSEEDSTTITID